MGAAFLDSRFVNGLVPHKEVQIGGDRKQFLSIFKAVALGFRAVFPFTLTC